MGQEPKVYVEVVAKFIKSTVPAFCPNSAQKNPKEYRHYG